MNENGSGSVPISEAARNIWVHYTLVSLVTELRVARERKKAETGKCGGRKSVHQAYPEAVAMARRLRADHPRLSYREISAALRDAGHVTRRGTEHSPMAIRHMLEGPTTPTGKPYSASAVQSMLG